MKVFNSLEEMEPYYNAITNTYKFIENNRVTDIEIYFDLKTESNISAWYIKAKNIKAKYIDSDVVIKNKTS